MNFLNLSFLFFLLLAFCYAFWEILSTQLTIVFLFFQKDIPLQYSWASLVAQLIKNLPAMWETWVGSLGWEDPLEEGMATHSSILAWRIPGIGEPGGLQSMGSQRVRHD